MYSGPVANAAAAHAAAVTAGGAPFGIRLAFAVALAWGYKRSVTWAVRADRESRRYFQDVLIAQDKAFVSEHEISEFLRRGRPSPTAPAASTNEVE